MGIIASGRINGGLEAMRNEASSHEDRAVGIVPSAPWRVREVRPLESYRLYVQFMDGTEGFIDLSKLISGDSSGVFIALRDLNFFKSVSLNHGAVTWPGELDLAPDAMYDIIKDKGEWILV